MNMRKINFTETVLRDANQSLIATRLPYDKFESILETMDKAGYYSTNLRTNMPLQCSGNRPSSHSE